MIFSLLSCAGVWGFSKPPFHPCAETACNGAHGSGGLCNWCRRGRFLEELVLILQGLQQLSTAFQRLPKTSRTNCQDSLIWSLGAWIKHRVLLTSLAGGDAEGVLWGWDASGAVGWVFVSRAGCRH